MVLVYNSNVGRKRNTTYVGEDRCDLEAGRALHVHEEAVGALDESLELVLSGFNVSVGVQKIVFQL